MGDTPLASLSLTHVHYNPDDPISYLCAWLALIPQGLCVTYLTLIWASREIEIILMFAGQMACEALNFLLKRLIKEERPKQMFGKGYGMPSSHAQFLSFFSIFLTLFLLFRHTPQLRSNHKSSAYTPLSHRVALSVCFLVLAVFVSASRIYLNYHTLRQVLVGCSAGAFSALAWFLITSWARKEGWIAWALDMRECRILRIRDLVLEEDLVEAGWREWEARRMSNRGRAEGADVDGRFGNKSR